MHITGYIAEQLTTGIYEADTAQCVVLIAKPEKEKPTIIPLDETDLNALIVDLKLRQLQLYGNRMGVTRLSAIVLSRLLSVFHRFRERYAVLKEKQKPRRKGHSHATLKM